MSILDVQDAPIPDSVPGENTLECEACGTHFEHTGRGRKPKKCPDCRANNAGTTTKPSSRRTTSKDVESAIAVLDGMYSTVSLGLVVLNPRAAVAWAGQLDTLQAQNRVTLAGDANLTKSINRLGERTGKAAFFLAHVFAIAPVVAVIREDMPKKPKRKPPLAETPLEDLLNETPTVNNNLGFFGA